MNWLDYVFIGVIAISAMISLVRGFVREVVSVVVWVAAFWLSTRYAGALADFAESYLDSPTMRLVVAFAALFIATLLLGALIHHLAGTMVGRTGLTGTDRALGMVFGGARGVLIVGVLVLLAGLTSVPRESWWQKSVMATWFTPWVCSVGVSGWLDGLELYRPLVTEGNVIEGIPATDYWRDFCGGPSTLASNSLLPRQRGR